MTDGSRERIFRRLYSFLPKRFGTIEIRERTYEVSSTDISISRWSCRVTRSRANPPHYEIVVNVFRTRSRHLVKFQSSRPIVAVRADSGNYRPIKPLLHPPWFPLPLLFCRLLSFRTVRRPSQHLPNRSHLSTSTISGIRRAPDSAQ